MTGVPGGDRTRAAARAGADPGRTRRSWGAVVGVVLTVAATVGCERRPSQPQPPRAATEAPATATGAPAGVPAVVPAEAVRPAVTPAAPAASQIAR